MTDPAAPASPAPPPSPPSSPPEPPGATFEQRTEGFGREVDDARLWGLALLAVGAWLFAGVTLGYDLPSIPVRDLRPLLLITLGAFVLVSGLARRT